MVPVLPKIKEFLQKEKTEAIEALIEQGKFYKKNWHLLFLDSLVIILMYGIITFHLINDILAITILILYLVFSSIRRTLLQIKHVTYYKIFNFFTDFSILILAVLTLFTFIYMVPRENSSIRGNPAPQGFLVRGRARTLAG